MVKNGSVDSLYYTYCDYQGNLLAVTDYQGKIKERLAYDPWGLRRNPDDWTKLDNGKSFLFSRGYTMHEHLDDFRLINMNGRVYDPVMAQFLSPDPFIQAPGNWYNYNRYGYCMNNPLIYSDPSGEFWFVVGGALLGGYLGAAAAEGWELNPTKWKWDGKTWAGIGFGSVIGAGGGYGFSQAAPALAETGFFSHFGESGTVAAYALTGAAAGGAIGYGSGFAGGMVYSKGDLSYSHKSGVHGAKVGASIGSVMGTLTGSIKSNRPEPDYDFKVNKANDESLNNNFGSDILSGELDPITMKNSMPSLPSLQMESKNSFRDYSLESFYSRTIINSSSLSMSYSNSYIPSSFIRTLGSSNYSSSFNWNSLLIPVQAAIEFYWWKNPYGSFPGMPIIPPFIDPNLWVPGYNPHNDYFL